MRRKNNIFNRRYVHSILILVAIIFGSINNRMLNDVVFDYKSYVLQTYVMLGEEDENDETEIFSIDINIDRDDTLSELTLPVIDNNTLFCSTDDIYQYTYLTNTLLFYLPAREITSHEIISTVQILC